MKEENTLQYKSVLKSTSLIGGSAFINILIGMIRTKFVAVLLGPTGVGLQNMYTTIMQTISTITGLGLNSSGVRSIAEANGQNDNERVARIVKTIRSTIWISGIIGTISTILLSGYISDFTFKTSEHRTAIIFLSIIVLLTNIQVGQTCILQGLRKIADIAKISIWGAINGTLISIPCFYFWGQDGIVPSLILTAIAALFTSWLYAKKIKIATVDLSTDQRKKELSELLSFGLPQMGTALVAAISAYFMRFIVNNQFGLEGVGIWSAAFNISGVLTNFVLNAMGTDYFPRLSSVSSDNEKINLEVNTQLEIALLLAGPALIITILFAPLGIHLLYTGKFDEAIPVLRWSVYGILGRVITWPLGFIMPAQGRGKLFLTTELISQSIWLLLTYYLALNYGLPGTGIAMLVNYIIYLIAMIIVAKIIANTKIQHFNWKLISLITSLCIASSLLEKVFTNQLSYYIVSLLLCIISNLYLLQRLSQKTGINLHSFISKIKGKLQ